MLEALTTAAPEAEATVAEAIPAEQSPQDAKLAETFQRITKQETHLKNERAKIEEARRSFEAEKEKAERYRSLEGKNPFEILEHFGITYDKLLQADKERANPVDPNVKKALEKVQELESKLISKEEQAANERRSSAEMHIKSEIQKTIREHEFDMIEILGAEQAVIDYMEEMYDQTNEIIDYKVACQAITDNLVEQYNKLSKSKWVRPKEEPEVLESAAEQTKPRTATLTQKMSQSSTTKPKVLSDAQRMAEALALLNNSFLQK